MRTNQSISHCSLLSKIAVHLHIRNYCQLFRSIKLFAGAQHAYTNNFEAIFELDECLYLTFCESHRKAKYVETSHRLKTENFSHCFSNAAMIVSERNGENERKEMSGKASKREKGQVREIRFASRASETKQTVLKTNQWLIYLIVYNYMCTMHHNEMDETFFFFIIVVVGGFFVVVSFSLHCGSFVRHGF